MGSESESRLAAEDRALIDQLYGPLRRYASAIRPPGEDANDLVQEALVRTLQHRGSLGVLDNPGAYLRKTILNLVLDHRRSEGRRLRALTRLASPEVESPSYSWELDELRAVPPRTRAVMYLHIIEGLPYVEIGRLLGCSSQSAPVAASRGKRQLQDALRREVGHAAS